MIKTLQRKSDEYTFKDETFGLEEIGTWKIDPAIAMIQIIDDYLYQDLELSEVNGASSLVLQMLYAIKDNLLFVNDTLVNLEKELKATGFYEKLRSKKGRKAA